MCAESCRALQEKLESWYRDYEVGRGPGRGIRVCRGLHGPARLPRGPSAGGGRPSGAVAAVSGPGGGFRGDGGTRSGGGHTGSRV